MSSYKAVVAVTTLYEVRQMVSGNFELKRFSHSVGQSWYHVVLIPRGRYPLFAQAHQRELAIKAINWICDRHKIDLFAKEVMEDHVHLFISCPPDYSIRKVIGVMKGGTSFFIRKEHPSLKKYPALWSKGYMYRSVGNVTAETVRKYIDESNTWTGLRQRTFI